ncbi:MAG: glycerol-3-phosphate dehydrogenase/oxidase, partial [Candidatus Omnitrophica bacterium]|nr:glycerol-3-phosphate dehydrogenase/oxidase [Candidatus Omnitrophota bacterium]
MKRDISRLKKEQFDLAIIGGGINGCGIARDAALRGLKTALIEKEDFASGTSGRTTKLIHGGIRYLEQLDFKLVCDGLSERRLLLDLAPSFVSPLEFLIPVYKNDPRPLWLMKFGVSLYDILAGKRVIRPHRVLNKDEVCALKTGVTEEGLVGGIIYFDAQVDDVKFCIANAKSAAENGACIANHCEAVSLIKEGVRVTGILAKDAITGETFEIKAKVVLNASGPWSDEVIAMDETTPAPFLRPTKGAHIIYPKLLSDRAILISAHKDKRVFFVIPYKGCSVIGTTDTDYKGSPDAVYAEWDDVNYLISEAQRVFPNLCIKHNEALIAYAGLRPLLNSRGLPWKASREHAILKTKGNLISVGGGKYTTYRLISEEAVDAVIESLGLKKRQCLTKKELFPKTGSTPQIKYAIDEEMAMTISD